MTSELLVTLIRLGYLALLWIFVFSTLAVLRRDIFGTVVTQRGPGRRRQQGAAHDAATTEGRRSILSRRVSQQQTAAPQHLKITGGRLSGTMMPLGSAPILVGRSPACTLVIDDSYTSGQHARMYCESGQWWIEDLNSTNGTFVDGVRIVTPLPIGRGNQVQIGQTTLEVV